MSSQPSRPSPVPIVLVPPAGLDLYQAQVEVSAQARQTVAESVFAQVAELVRAFTQWYDDLAVRRLAKDITGVVQAGQQTVAASEDAYMAYVLSSQSGRTVRPVGQVIVDDLRAGVDPMAVYERLGEQFRYSRSIGNEPGKALAFVLTRAEVMTDTDMSLAARAQSQKSLQATSLAVAYRRVIHPELSRGGTCGMCIAASDRVYKKADLLPIHGRCHCTVAPIMRGGADPGSSLNNLSLTQLYGDAGGNQAMDLKRTRYSVVDGGQLGPTLVPKRRVAKGVPLKPEKVTSVEGSLGSKSDKWLQHQIGVTEGLKDSNYRTAQLARLRAELAKRAK